MAQTGQTKSGGSEIDETRRTRECEGGGGGGGGGGGVGGRRRATDTVPDSARPCARRHASVAPSDQT